MHVTNATAWATLRGSAHKEVEVEEIVAVTEMVVSAVGERNASSATNLDTLRASAKRIRIFATAAMVSDTLRKTVSRSVPCVKVLRQYYGHFYGSVVFSIPFVVLAVRMTGREK